MTAFDRALELVNGFRITQVVHAAAKLRIPDLLSGGPMTADELAAATQIDLKRLRRLLGALVALGVLAETEDNRFSNTEVGELFRQGVPGSRRAGVIMNIPESYLDWGYFMQTLRTGAVGHRLAHGETLWETIARDPDFASRFNQAMVSNSEEATAFVASSADFASAGLIVDVGGGKGALAGGILKVHPHLRAIIYDLGAGLAEAPEYLTALGVIDRCEIREGDFFKSAPGGGDVYLLKDILHDWDDDHAAKILSTCRRAMQKEARLLVVERLLPAPMTTDPAHVSAALIDLQMMVQLGGQERTRSDFAELFERTGFRMDGSVAGRPWSLVEALAV